LPEAALHLLEISRRQLGNEKTHRKLQRLDKRILNVASQQHRIQAGKMGKYWPVNRPTGS
jgi:hypothetical protein